MQLQQPDQRMPVRLAAVSAGADIRAGPQTPEALAAHRQLTDEGGQARVVGVLAGGQAQVTDDIEAALLPLRVQTVLRLLQEEMPGDVHARDRAAVKESGEAVAREYVQAVV